MTPTLVPFELLPNAIALRSTVSQAVVVVGPAVGGLLFALGPEVVYATGAVLMLISVGFVVPMKLRAIEESPFEAGGSRLASLLAGLRFVRRTPVLLGAISLDLVAVLLGGAVALLPVFARDVLDVGPVGLGLLRSAPAVGALLAGIMLTRRPLRGMAGRKLLIVVAVFGASMVVFGLSRSFPLSFAALAVSGFADMISMNIRSMITALATPDALRGRVNAVEMVFISASNELGAFESGAAAALIGAVPAVVMAARRRSSARSSGRGSSRRWRGSIGSSRCMPRCLDRFLTQLCDNRLTLARRCGCSGIDCRRHTCSFSARSSSPGSPRCRPSPSAPPPSRSPAASPAARTS